MTKAEMIDAIAKSNNVPEEMTKKAVSAIFDTIFDEIKKTVKENSRFSIPGFGTFTKKERAARDGRNPKTGETIRINGFNTMTFKASKDIKEYMK